MKQWWAQQLDGLEDVSLVSRLAVKMHQEAQEQTNHEEATKLHHC